MFHLLSKAMRRLVRFDMECRACHCFDIAGLKEKEKPSAHGIHELTHNEENSYRLIMTFFQKQSTHCLALLSVEKVNCSVHCVSMSACQVSDRHYLSV